MSILDKFLEYIGPADSLYSYTSSYKILFLLYMFQLVDKEGKVDETELYKSIKHFYIDRNSNKLKAETGNSLIQKEINNLTLDGVRAIMNRNAFRVIKKQGYIDIREIDKSNYIYFQPDLWRQLTLEGINRTKNILEEKLRLYYRERLGDESMNILELEDNKNLISHIRKYILSKGFRYDEDEIANFYLCLKSKPFVLLAGISGTGKSKLVQLFAEAVGATSANGRYNIIPVRPDWSDPSDLLGYRNIEGKFQPGPLTSIIKNAIENPELPYLVCLDEMNLARVEYYFSDILSIIETRDIKESSIITDKLFKNEAFGEDKEARDKYGHLYLPDNLYIIGTVNMDETTFPFSKKVLDRANTIEFNKVDLSVDFGDFANTSLQLEAIKLDNRNLVSKYVKLLDCIDQREHIEKVVYLLEKINVTLEKLGLQFGYRVRDEIVFYTLYAVKENLMTFNTAMDYAIKQKILPRIQGSNLSIKEVLIELFLFFTNDASRSYDALDNDIAKRMSRYIKDNNVRYPLCSEKICKMIGRYELDGFTNFWE